MNKNRNISTEIKTQMDSDCYIKNIFLRIKNIAILKLSPITNSGKDIGKCIIQDVQLLKNNLKERLIKQINKFGIFEKNAGEGFIFVTDHMNFMSRADIERIV